MIKFRLLLTLFLFLFSLCLFSQTKITGTIFCDDNMNVPLKGVSIKIYGHNGKIIDKVKTDCDGSYAYQFLNKKPVKIVYTKKKYTSVTVDNLNINKDCIYEFIIVFKKALSLHDESYDGTSTIAKSDVKCL